MMKIGIIVHSHTGNTYFVAQKLKEGFEKYGNQVDLERVSAVNEDRVEARKVQLANKPEVKEYDLLVLGAPVRGFSLSPVMTEYIKQLDSLHGKKAACYVTEFFPHPSMGGSRAMEQMKELCGLKGLEVCETGIINWSGINREKKIEAVVRSFSRIV